jgi:hypothetical protein
MGNYNARVKKQTTEEPLSPYTRPIHEAAMKFWAEKSRPIIEAKSKGMKPSTWDSIVLNATELLNDVTDYGSAIDDDPDRIRRDALFNAIKAAEQYRYAPKDKKPKSLEDALDGSSWRELEKSGHLP